jgi:hypothetical protein
VLGRFFAWELFVVIKHLWFYELNHRKSISQEGATKLLFQALFCTTAHGLNYFKYFTFGKYNGFVSKAMVSACMYFLV